MACFRRRAGDRLVGRASLAALAAVALENGAAFAGTGPTTAAPKGEISGGDSAKLLPAGTTLAQASGSAGAPVLDDLTIERRGGFAGLPARAKLSMDSLAPTDKAAIEALFNAKVRLPPAQGADRFTYKLTRTGPQGVQSIEAPEHLVPPGVAAQVKDELP